MADFTRVGQYDLACASAENVPGGSGGQACEASLVPLRGGSGGGRGGAREFEEGGGGGGGGGAVQITSYTAIRLMPQALIDAGGAGGARAERRDYGGGGGGGGGS